MCSNFKNINSNEKNQGDYSNKISIVDHIIDKKIVDNNHFYNKSHDQISNQFE